MSLGGTGHAAATDIQTTVKAHTSTLPPPRLTLAQLFEAQRASVRSTADAPAPLGRVAGLAQAAPFDVRAWAQDPDAYLAVIEPSRIFQTARPGRGVPATQVDGPGWVQVAPGETITIRIRTAPDAPLSFLSNGLGAFANGLTAVTLRSDAQGLVEVPWTAIRGTTADVSVVAASPLATGQALLLITVE